MSSDEGNLGFEKEEAKSSGVNAAPSAAADVPQKKRKRNRSRGKKKKAAASVPPTAAAAAGGAVKPTTEEAPTSGLASLFSAATQAKLAAPLASGSFACVLTPLCFRLVDHSLRCCCLC